MTVDLIHLCRVAEHIPPSESIALTETEFTAIRDYWRNYWQNRRQVPPIEAPYVLNGRRVVIVPDRMMA